MVLYLDPFDYIEINLKKGTSSIFSEFKKENNLLLDIETFDEKGNSKEFGPYDKNSHLYAVFFDNKNYTLKFTNEGDEEAEFAIIFSNYVFENVTRARNRISKNIKFTYPPIVTIDVKTFNYDIVETKKDYFTVTMIQLTLFDVFIYVIFSFVFCRLFSCN